MIEFMILDQDYILSVSKQCYMKIELKEKLFTL